MQWTGPAQPPSEPAPGDLPSEEVLPGTQWEVDRAAVDHLFELPVDDVVGVVRALQKAAAEIAATTSEEARNLGSTLAVFDHDSHPEVADRWDVICNHAESVHALAPEAIEILHATWDPGTRLALHHWALANPRHFREGNSWLRAIDAAAQLECADYAATLSSDGGLVELHTALTDGNLPCKPELAIDRPELAREVMRVWRLASTDSPLFDSRMFQFSRTKISPSDATTEKSVERERKSSLSKPVKNSTLHPATPQQSGELLEVGLFEVLQKIFDFSENTTGYATSELRRQLAGTQFGTDLVVRTRGREVESTCLIECKNFDRPIRLKDISDKLLAAEAAFESEHLDYWILLSPKADPANELDLQIAKWNKRGRFPFRIQVWSPQNNVSDLFAGNPRIFEAIYGHENRRKPRDIRSLASEYSERITPWPRLPTQVVAHLENSRSFLLPSERNWDAVMQDSIVRKGTDTDGRPLARGLDDEIDEVLRQPDSVNVVLLLAEFGEGKSFYTATYCKRLRQDFLRDPTPDRHIPFRFYLKDFRQVQTAQEFVRLQLERIGILNTDWRSLLQEWKTIIILDGMDEMSVAQDEDTLRANLRKLSGLLQELADSPILITSRPNFAGSERDREKVLDRLRQPTILGLRQPDRDATVSHLRTFAKEHQLTGKLERLKNLYDPIGLAGKVLFLEMIKETLADLPEDRFNEQILYETYIDKSIDRKIELLRDPDENLTDRELKSQLQSLLEQLAVEMHKNGEGVVDLRSFLRDAGGAASRLWDLADAVPADELDDDAATRVSGRSLLRRVPLSRANSSEDSTGWKVDFFHRSMKEYFVAKALVGALEAEDPFATMRPLLSRVRLQKEIVAFFRLLVADAPDVSDVLSSIARSASSSARGSGGIGGAAATLFHASGGDFHHHPWSGLDLRGALLERADLSGVALRNSDLRNADLTSADLTSADLRGCDLRGAKLTSGERIVDFCGLDSRTLLGLTSAGELLKVTVDDALNLHLEDLSLPQTFPHASRVTRYSDSLFVLFGGHQVTMILWDSAGPAEGIATFRTSGLIRSLEALEHGYIGIWLEDMYRQSEFRQYNPSAELVKHGNLFDEVISCRLSRPAMHLVLAPGIVVEVPFAEASESTRPSKPELIEDLGAGVEATSVFIEHTRSRGSGRATVIGTADGGVKYHGRSTSHQFVLHEGGDGATGPVSAVALLGQLIIASSQSGAVSLWIRTTFGFERRCEVERRMRCANALVDGAGGHHEVELLRANGAI